MKLAYRSDVPISASRVRAFRETGFSSRYRCRRIHDSLAERICVRFSTASCKAGLAAKARSHKWRRLRSYGLAVPSASRSLQALLSRTGSLAVLIGSLVLPTVSNAQCAYSTAALSAYMTPQSCAVTVSVAQQGVKNRLCPESACVLRPGSPCSAVWLGLAGCPYPPPWVRLVGSYRLSGGAGSFSLCQLKLPHGQNCLACRWNKSE